MIHVVLYEPEIPPNTGNVARTCAATDTPLHLIEPLGFSISDRQVRRAGLDYWDKLDLHVHSDWDAFLRYSTVGRETPVIAPLSTRGSRLYTAISTDLMQPDNRDPLYLLFGPETRGLPATILGLCGDRVYRVPMSTEFRSLNLSNTVALVLYNLLESRGFPGLV
ncbi:MAG: tRNA (cytidine(34)-2'-O)-methyltransferase [Spirochaetaceae bacterium]|nr:MAG: tRNA (cytidine(34)-2'-O)-methyltransferase [Spirochaetaceae bacterium]